MVALFGPGSCMASTRWPPLRPGAGHSVRVSAVGAGVWVVVGNPGSFLGEGTLSGPGFLVTCPQAFPPPPTPGTSGWPWGGRSSSSPCNPGFAGRKRNCQMGLWGLSRSFPGVPCIVAEWLLWYRRPPTACLGCCSHYMCVCGPLSPSHQAPLQDPERV